MMASILASILKKKRDSENIFAIHRLQWDAMDELAASMNEGDLTTIIGCGSTHLAYQERNVFNAGKERGNVTFTFKVVCAMK